MAIAGEGLLIPDCRSDLKHRGLPSSLPSSPKPEEEQRRFLGLPHFPSPENERTAVTIIAGDFAVHCRSCCVVVGKGRSNVFIVSGYRNLRKKNQICLGKKTDLSLVLASSRDQGATALRHERGGLDPGGHCAGAVPGQPDLGMCAPGLARFVPGLKKKRKETKGTKEREEGGEEVGVASGLRPAPAR
ncbi:hypothetical protein CKAN_00000200 [Cinnamomum micranthum f. kanehirae]|uniref:Uncharacterized protein n=1 Tax=Cinnamomum micranthum f. kanehirae TaxID=337451 RepID=A0A443MZY4_9MAGN|nr:hypothetical protein CKAN_00000200 [Cinnamomum micranthum f. kanehirae]